MLKKRAKLQKKAVRCNSNARFLIHFNIICTSLPVISTFPFFVISTNVERSLDYARDDRRGLDMGKRWK